MGLLKDIPRLAMNSGMRTGYEKVPDPLMGFSRPWKGQKGFNEQNYPLSMSARIQFPGDRGPFTDEIRGMNALHAMERARRNWPGANIEAMSFDKLKAIIAAITASSALPSTGNAQAGPTIANSIKQMDTPLQEPTIDPTTLLAGPARWGGGLMNMGLDALMRYFTR